MTFNDFISVVAESIETFYVSISLIDALCLAGIFIGMVFVLSMIHILFGAKASTSRRARRLSRYFENVYIGSSYEAGKFYRRHKHLLNRAAKDEFEIFMRSTVPITNTDFVHAVMTRGARSLSMVRGVHFVAIAIAESFLVVKTALIGYAGMECAVYLVLPMLAMLILQYVVFLSERLVARGHIKAGRRLGRAVKYIDYNMRVVPYTETAEFKRAVDMVSPEKEARVDSMMTRLRTEANEYIERSQSTDEDVKLDEIIEGMNLVE